MVASTCKIFVKKFHQDWLLFHDNYFDEKPQYASFGDYILSDLAASTWNFFDEILTLNFKACGSNIKLF